jgi:curli production assembly/transport component CsgG
VVGIYKFRDQTGQYKASEWSTFSTAVTQGQLLLIKALKIQGFIPIERVETYFKRETDSFNQTRVYRADPKAPQITPLLYAGVLLEGGIISYDSNIIIGFGARYFGTGASVRYRQDRVTIYLRMVSTANGKYLNQFIFQNDPIASN